MAPDKHMSIPTASSSQEYWEGIFATRPWGSYPPEELVRFMARHFRSVADRSAVRVLEIGCGPGPNIWYLAREGFAVAGIDGSPTAVRQAGARLAAEGLPDADIRVGDFSGLPWTDESFDVVIDIAALYANSVKTIVASLDEVRRVLKPGGYFFGKMFGDETTGSRSGEMIEPGTVRHPQIGPCAGNDIAHFFSREELGIFFSGFKALSIDQVHRTDHNGDIHIFEWIVSAQK